MKFTADSKAISDAVALAARVATNKATLPVLTGVCITADEDVVVVEATDLEVSIYRRLTAQVDEPGTVIVPAKLLDTVLKKTTEGEVKITAGDGNVKIKGNGTTTLKTLATDDYPNIERPSDGDAVFTIEMTDFAFALSQVARAARREEDRPILTGVQVSCESRELTLAATDSYRLAVRMLATDCDTDFERVVPATACQEIARAIQGTATVVVGTNHFTVSSADASITTRYVAGEYPAWRRWMPQASDLPVSVTVGQEAVRETVQRVAALAGEKQPVKVALGTDHIELEAHTPDVGEASEQVDATVSGTNGNAFTICFNPGFLNDGLAAIATPDVYLQAKDGISPAILKGVGDDSFTYLLMPVRV